MGADKQSAKILAIDDNAEALFALEQLLISEGYSVKTAHSGKEALASLEQEIPDLILSDINMPPPDGLELTRHLRSDPVLQYVVIVLVTARDDLSEVVEGLGCGADDYVKKPFSREELLARVKACLRRVQLNREFKRVANLNRELEGELKNRTRFEDIIGKSAPMQQVYSLIERIKEADVPVLVTGESGTGKELVAAALHRLSPRANKPLIVANCSAFNENLLESELFGHVKGAFTGAIRDKEGLFSAADGGTFFLDELGEMPTALQVKLLRVLQDGTFTPVGGTSQKKVDVRIVAATNRNLQEMISKGAFREDLYYRLNVVNIHLPPLRERRGDIPLLCEQFLAKACAKNSKIQKRLTSESLRMLCDYNWPGNIRELQNEIERIVLLSAEQEEIASEFLSPHLKAGLQGEGKPPAGRLKDALDELEREMIADALRRTGYNKSEAARELGISRSNLIAKVQAFGLEGSG